MSSTETYLGHLQHTRHSERKNNNDSHNLLRFYSSLQLTVVSTLQYFSYHLIFTISCQVGTLIPTPPLRTETQGWEAPPLKWQTLDLNTCSSGIQALRSHFTTQHHLHQHHTYQVCYKRILLPLSGQSKEFRTLSPFLPVMLWLQ